MWHWLSDLALHHGLIGPVLVAVIVGVPALIVLGILGTVVGGVRKGVRDGIAEGRKQVKAKNS